jgi:hypothetical protein
MQRSDRFEKKVKEQPWNEVGVVKTQSTKALNERGGVSPNVKKERFQLSQQNRLFMSEIVRKIL